MFWLAHHRADELHRTYWIAGVHVCARCLGLYPVMALAIVLQFRWRAPLSWPWDGVWSIGWFLPGLIDWAVGRFRPSVGSNPWRTLTGVALGLALGRTLYIHLQRPLPLWLWVQIGLVTGVGLPVILLSARRRTPG